MLAPLALQRLVKLLDAESENVQLEASKQLLDRAGYGRPKDDSQFVHQIGRGEMKIIIDLRSPTQRGESNIIEGKSLSNRGSLPLDGKPLALSRPIRGSEI